MPAACAPAPAAIVKTCPWCALPAAGWSRWAASAGRSPQVPQGGALPVAGLGHAHPSAGGQGCTLAPSWRSHRQSSSGRSGPSNCMPSTVGCRWIWPAFLGHTSTQLSSPIPDPLYRWPPGCPAGAAASGAGLGDERAQEPGHDAGQVRGWGCGGGLSCWCWGRPGQGAFLAGRRRVVCWAGLALAAPAGCLPLHRDGFLFLAGQPDRAWALTAAPGLPCRAEVSLERAFEPGMAYVALSRVKSLDGLRIQGRIAPQALRAGGCLLPDSCPRRAPLHAPWPPGAPARLPRHAKVLGPARPAGRAFSCSRARTRSRGLYPAHSSPSR